MLKEIFDSTRFEIWLTIGILIFVLILQRVLHRRKLNLPPGPWGLPIVGYFPFLSKDSPHMKFTQLAEKYGNVFSFYLGSKYAVVLNDGDSIKEAFGKREFLGRPPNTPFNLFNIQTPFFSDNYHMWQEQRRFVVQTMKDLGLGKTKIEGHVQDEIQHFLSILQQSNGKPMNLVKPLTPSMSNNICSMVFGQRYDYEDPERLTLDGALEFAGRILGQTSAILFFPWVLKIPFLYKRLRYDEVTEAVGKVISIFESKIRKHKETLDPKNVRDFIDGYLIEIKTRSEKNPETTFSEGTLKGSVQNLFGAGSETVRTSITWCIYVMAAIPEVQKKVRQEIKEVIGDSRIPQFSDQKNMSYTQAVLREIMRWKTIVPLNVLRYTLDDTEVSGYTIPKGTTIFANLWAVHHDPRYWKDPENFVPERFLDSKGMLLKQDYFMPFSVGKRSCPGETFAMMELFLYFTSILQKFHVSFPEGYKPTYEAELGITYRLKRHDICFQSI